MTNEFQVITFFLSKRGDEIGVDSEDLMKILDIESKARFFKLMDSYARHVALVGLRVAQNPLNGRWFLVQDPCIQELARVNPFPGSVRLGATLVSVLLATMLEKAPPAVQRVKNLRNKQDISKDLKELEEMGLIKVRDDKVLLTDKVGYFIDLESFLAVLKREVERSHQPDDGKKA